MSKYAGPAKPIPVRVPVPQRVARFMPCIIYTVGVVVVLLDVYVWRP